MASSSSSLPTVTTNMSPPNLTFHEKLEGPNYLSWLTQFSPILRSTDSMGFVDGTEPCPPKFLVDENDKQVPNPAFTLWQKKDQTILSWINITLSTKVLSTIYGLETSRQVWTALANQFANQSKTRIANLKKQLQSLHQGSKSCTDYLQTAKAWADQLAAVGKPLPDEDLITYLSNGLNSSYNSFISTISILSRDKQLTFEDFQEELLNHEMLLNLQQTKVADTSTFALFNQKQAHRNFPPRPRGGSSQRFQSRPYGPKYDAVAPTPRYNAVPPPTSYAASPRPPPLRPAANSKPIFSSAPKIPCQICGKLNHLALDCFHRMDYSFQGRHPPSQLQAMVAHNNTAFEDQEWYADSAANAHITHDLANLQVQQPFETSEAVGVGNGTALAIANSGSSILPSPKSDFLLNNVLHCPRAAANLISIQRFCLDNDCYFILTSTHYYIIDLQTQNLLLEGKSENGMYPLRFGKKKTHLGSKDFTALIGIKTSSLVWHHRLGHPSSDIVTRIIKDNKLPTSSFDLNKTICSSCQLGKGKKQPFHASNRITTSPLHLIHTDLWTSPIASITGFKYYVAFIDDFSRYTWIYPLHQKSETFHTFVKFKDLVENQFSTKIKQLQSDGGGEYTSHQFQSYLNQHGIAFRKTCPYTSPQNGIAERKLRHILETGLTLLAHSHLSNKYWVDSFLTAVYTINRLPTPVLNQVSPYEKLFKHPPNYQHFKVFGCLCYPLLRPYGLHKLEFRSKPCIFLGYHFAGYKCLDPVTNKAYLSRHVVFDESSFPAKEQATSLLPSQLFASGNSTPQLLSPSLFSIPAPASLSPNADISSSIMPQQSPTLSPEPVPPSTDTPEPLSPEPVPPSTDTPEPLPLLQEHHPSSLMPQQPPTLSPEPTPSSSSIPLPLPETVISSTDFPEPDSTLPSSLTTLSSPTELSAPIQPSHSMTTRSHSGTLKPTQFPGFHLYHNRYPLLDYHSSFPEIEPSCYSKAAADPRWQAAMSAEFTALIDNKTWSLCPRPPNQHVIHNKWVYKIKRRADGSVERFKARLVAKGFEQQAGIDYTETFSPVIKPATIRLLLALAVNFNWPIRQLDISNAFLHGSLTEEVYMEQPSGFVDKSHPELVCKLHKAIYGLKQAPRAWYTRLSQFLLDLGFTASFVDTSLFFHTNGSLKIFLLIYVDDIIVTGTHPHVISAIITRMQQEFPVKDLGPLSYFLGIQVTRTSTGLHLCQSKYVADILTRTHMADAKPAKTPCTTGSKLSRFDGTPLPDYSAYRSLVGALQYCTLTRPDISYSVNQLCQHLHHPTSAHWTAAKRVLRFLKDTCDHGLTYSPSNLQLNAFCDSDWAGSPDDRRSTSGSAVFLGESLLSWSAKKQNVVSRSSTEAEYRSLALVTAELFWIRMLFCELRISLPTAPIIWCDNLSALALASNPVYHARTKHIEVDYHFVREKVLNKDISIAFISTDDQIADIFTKGLSTARFLFLKSKLKVLSSPISLRGDVKLCNAAATSTPTDTAEVAATTAYLEEDQLTWNHDSEDSAVVNESAATKGKCHKTWGKDQPASTLPNQHTAAYLVVMNAIKGNRDQQQTKSLSRQSTLYGKLHTPANHGLSCSPRLHHQRKDLEETVGALL
jgi:transposase InsO family protein